MEDRGFLSRLADAFSQWAPGQSPEERRRKVMLLQMQQAQDIADQVRHQAPPAQPFQWAPRPMPELPTEYQPPNRWNYGTPVRLA